MSQHLRIAWQEDACALRELYAKERDIQRRTRLQALWQLRRGVTVSEVAGLVGKHPRTVQEWVAWYRHGGLAEVLARRHGGYGGKKRWLTEEQEQALVAAASAGEVRRIQDGVNWAREHYGVAYTYWGMRSVFARLGLRKKVPRPRNPKACAPEQEAWKKGDVLPS